MNKKILMFGIPILAVGLVCAVLVTYLSNTASVEVKVDSPFTSGFYNGVEVVDYLSLPDMYFGETFSMENRIVNRGSVDTNVYIKYKISNSINDVTEQDFSAVNIDVRSDGMGSYHFFTGTLEELCDFSSPHGATECSIDNGDLIVLIPNFFWHNEKAEIFTNLTFSSVEPTTYKIESNVEIR